MFDPISVKKDFPILSRQVHGKPLVYLDNAATSQKPQEVIQAIVDYYQNHNANVHRGVHTLSDESTSVWEKSRQTISNFFGADEQELILVRNTTEAINGVAYGWGLDQIKSGDVILSTEMEHHSDIVVWQQLARRVNAKLELIQVKDDGTLDLEDLKSRVKQHGEKLKLIALAHVSNTLGTLNPVEKVVDLVAKTNCRVLIDAAQSVPHMTVNFHKLGVDFLTFSSHKMLGPMGVGGLLVKKELLKSGEFKPWLFGGGMIQAVYQQETEFAEELSDRFTAGTPDVAGAVGLAAACEYLKKLGMADVYQHDQDLVNYAFELLANIPEVTIVGPMTNRVGSVAFIYESVHPHDVAQILDSEGIAVRSGHHCTMPLHTKFNWAGTIRMSFQVYNSLEDIEALVSALAKVNKVFNVESSR